MGRPFVTLDEIRPSGMDLEYRKILSEEETFFLDSSTCGIRQDLGTLQFFCLFCMAPLIGLPQSGYFTCFECGSLLSSPRLSRHLIPKTWSPDSAASFFHRHVCETTSHIRRQIMEFRLTHLLRYLSSGRILDVGCSIGLFLDTLRQAGFFSEGSEVVEFSIQTCVAKGHLTHAGPVEQAGLEEAAYDAICAWDVLTHVADPEEFFTEIVRLLKPGGFLFMTTSNASGLEYDFVWEDGHRHHPNLKPHIFLQIPSLMGLAILLDKVGLNILDISTPGTMDISNLRRTFEVDGFRFNNPLLNNLVTKDDEDSARIRHAFSQCIVRHRRSGHCSVVARSPHDLQL